MTKLARTPAPKVKDLAQQKTDFTAEGAPAPGKVNTAVPSTAGKARKLQRAPGTAPRAHQRASAGHGR